MKILNIIKEVTEAIVAILIAIPTILGAYLITLVGLVVFTSFLWLPGVIVLLIVLKICGLI